MAEISVTSSRKKKASFSRSHHNRSTRVDLTPMVDLRFLLITFFVFTTSLSEPKAMEFMQAHDGKPMHVKQSAAMTILVGDNHELFYYHGEFDPGNAGSQIHKTGLPGIRTKIMAHKLNTNPDYLMYIIKASNSSTFGDHVDLLDEMTICNIPSGHYAELDLTSEETVLTKEKQ
jgi:biopolymer transport protein ExbD